MENSLFFRNKFRKIISSEVEQDAYVSAFRKYLKLSFEDALQILWSLTYDPETDVLERIGLWDGNDPQNFIVLRNELRYQYEKVHPDFLQVDVPEKAREEFISLEKRTDSIVATVLFRNIKYRTMVFDESSKDRVAFLLDSNKENLQFGGIRSLGFNKRATEFLLPYHSEIHALYKALWRVHKEAHKNTPLHNLGTLIEKAGMDLPFDFGDSIPDIPNEEQPKEIVILPVASPITPEVAKTEFRRLFAENVFMYKDAFASFVKDDNMNALLEIGKLGFDLNEVMAKKEKIYNLISALQAKEDAEFLLNLATRDLNG